MSRQSARIALATYLGGPVVPTEPGVYSAAVGSQPVAGLNTMRTAMPAAIPETDYSRNASPGAASSSVGVVLISRQVERRDSMGGYASSAAPAGLKRVDYEAQIVVYHRSTTETAEQAQADADARTDAILALLRGDPTLGGRVWQAGEAVMGTPSITVTFAEPSTFQDASWLDSCVIGVPVTEWIRA